MVVVGVGVWTGSKVGPPWEEEKGSLVKAGAVAADAIVVAVDGGGDVCDMCLRREVEMN